MPSETRFATCMLCEAMCGIAVRVENVDGSSGEGAQPRATRIEGDKDDPLSRGHICPKAVALEDVRLDPDRVREPYVREGASWRALGWDEAIDTAASRLASVARTYGKDAVAVYSGNPTAHNGHAFVGSFLFHHVLRTRSNFSATSVDQLPHMLAALEMFGHQLLLPVPDVDRTQYFLCIGANPLVSGGSLMSAPGIERRLRDVRARGGKVVVIDPRRTETARVADEHHFVRPGSDALLLMAMVRTLFEEKRVRPGHLADFLGDLAEMERACAPFSPERVAEHVGIAAADIQRLARELSEAPCGVVYGRVGVCQQEFGAVAAWLVYALNVLTGNLDRAGGAMFTTPAIDLVSLAARTGHKGAFGRFRSTVRGLPEFGGELPAACLAEEIEAGEIRALVTLAGNPVASVPNGGRLSRALERLDVMVSLDLYKNETTRHAHVLLPTTFGLEREHYDLLLSALAVRNTVRWSPAVFAPPPGVRDDWTILADLACAFARHTPERGRMPGIVARAARALGPERTFDLAMRAGPYRLSLRKLRRHPHGLDLGPLRPRFPGSLYTPDRRIRLAPQRFLDDLPRLLASLETRPGNGGELTLIGRRTLRSNNSWMHNSQRLVKGREACTLLMHPGDASARGLTSGARVRLRSRVGEVEVPLEVSDEVAPGVVSLPHGWGHAKPDVELRVARAHAGASINDVTDDGRVDAVSGNAAFSGTPVIVERA
jgi:anaerobic selenocysteine-containing dehydrogenase